MAQVIITNPNCIGLGIEEDTAVVVHNGINAEVVGSGLVIVIEGFEIENANISDFRGNRPIKSRNLKVHLLSGGDVYEIPHVHPPHK